MFHSIVFGLIIISTFITADPGLADNTDTYGAQPPPPAYNYHEYRSQQQQQTPSPYANKRNQNSNNYADQQYPPSSAAAAYGNVPVKSSAANQCKLHINCPSKLNEENKILDIFLISYFRCTKSCYIGYSRTCWYILFFKKINILNEIVFF